MIGRSASITANVFRRGLQGCACAPEGEHDPLLVAGEEVDMVRLATFTSEEGPFRVMH
jgi:hypothetical protein